ncbi:MAG: hemerythrin domain-containing protein [Phycisphaeraceae bacterium]|nr:hemerythrin domain-containing protein [Phycisphaeraceae bacterium]
MPITLGQTPDAGFDEPLQLLSDCHRRIEKFLGILARIAEERRGGALGAEHREALEAALRYFKNAAPWHTRDEEDSLFPRMRQLNDRRVDGALTTLESLEADHDRVEAGHAEVDQLGRLWIERGTLQAAEIERLGQLLEQLCQVYQRHIAEEDDVIFPLAAHVLNDSQLAEVGLEMAQRRGIDPDRPAPRCRHARAKPSQQPDTEAEP